MTNTKISRDTLLAIILIPLCVFFALGVWYFKQVEKDENLLQELKSVTNLRSLVGCERAHLALVRVSSREGYEHLISLAEKNFRHECPNGR